MATKNSLIDKNTKYVFLMLKIINGEYEYESVGVHGIHKDINIEEWAEDYASDFYASKGDVDGDTYFFNGGVVAVRVRSIENITKEEYDVLSKFINV